MIKSCFTYDNKEFKYKFQILESYDLSYGYSILKYKYKKFQLSNVIYLDSSAFNSYEGLLNKYNNISKKDLSERLKNEIIKDYEFFKIKRKFR